MDFTSYDHGLSYDHELSAAGPFCGRIRKADHDAGFRILGTAKVRLYVTKSGRGPPWKIVTAPESVKAANYVCRNN